MGLRRLDSEPRIEVMSGQSSEQRRTGALDVGDKGAGMPGGLIQGVGQVPFSQGREVC
jgi:hypothetical protein